jgi:hypothetical protein
MKTKLRRRLQETTADLWSDQDIEEILNLALIEMQKEVMKVDPEAFSAIDRADQVVNQEFYQFPAGLWFEREVRLLGDDGTYKTITRVAFAERADRTTGEDVVYARFDRGNFVLSPIPSVSKINGIELVWVPTLAMATDADVPPIHLGLHGGIVLFGELIANGDTGDSSDDTLKELARVINSIPQYYLISASTPSRFVVQVSKDY